MFQVARPVTLATIPEGLQVLADRATVSTPVTFDWGWQSTHSLSPISPQQDRQGNWWVFASWSDNGAATHAYQVGESTRPDTVTATYVAGGAVALTTLPANLKLKVDGRDNWPSYSFLWGVGETHHLEAPATQMDAQGRVWEFSSWSNGGAAGQDLNVTPEIAKLGIRLIATYTPVGHLTVNSTIPGLTVQVDGSSCATPCDVQRAVGTQVRVSAPASIPQSDGVRADFAGWPGGGSEWTGTLTGDPVTLTASYRMMNRLAASATPPDGATWSLQPASSDGFYDAQTTVVVAVTALPGYRFGSWTGDLSGSKPAGAVSMNQPRSVTARLDRVPYIAPAGVSNAAGITPQNAVAPGSVVAIFGASLANDLTVGPSSPLAQTLAGMTVRSGDRLLPLFFVSPKQINVQLPDDFGLGAQALTVSAQGQPDVQGTFTVARNAPGVFQNTTADNQSFAVATHEDGSPSIHRRGAGNC
jgi:Divergent InlB B-repeat domain